MVSHVLEHIPHEAWKHNQAIERSCHKYRPDLSLELDDRLICIECDENQHISYKCDIPRQINIVQDIGLPTVFIRWNPDKYYGKESVSERLDALVDKIEMYMACSVDAFPQGYPLIEYMYYDQKNIDGADQELSELLVQINI
jgi:hypothetical protein